MTTTTKERAHQQEPATATRYLTVWPCVIFRSIDGRSHNKFAGELGPADIDSASRDWLLGEGAITPVEVKI